jgi:hypothetical protein
MPQRRDACAAQKHERGSCDESLTAFMRRWCQSPRAAGGISIHGRAAKRTDAEWNLHLSSPSDLRFSSVPLAANLRR